MAQLGTLEELPLDYRNGLTAQNLVPLWPNLRAALPYNIPSRRTKPMVWRYADIRPELLKAGELTPIEKAERRVLVLANPGLGLENMQATPSIYIGMQLILPRETAPNHKHSPSAVRFVQNANRVSPLMWRIATSPRPSVNSSSQIHPAIYNTPAIW